MIQFIKNAMSELEHVVWPTPNESKKYMIYTISVIIIMASILALLGYLIRGGLSGVRGQFDHTPLSETTVSGEELATENDLKKLQEQFQQNRATVSGSTVNITPEGDTSLSGSSDIVLP